MTDIYDNFAELEKAENRKNYRIRPLPRPAAVTAVIAPHGGGIEPGTSKIARAIASADLSFYAFEGKKARHNRDLHITSTHFDEPKCLALLAASEHVLAIHGQCGDEDVVLLGGLDGGMKQRLRESLRQSGFTVQAIQKPGLDGRSEKNICNRGIGGAGVQMELSAGMRRRFFKSRQGRQRFRKFVAAVRKVFAPESRKSRPAAR
jgi:phage replication-related protein YjqB (UPF0714/DUF867 family)